jgi:hypothetical protein
MPRETGGTGKDAEQSYEPIRTCEGGEPQGSRKGRPRHPLEGRVNKRTYLLKET